MSREDFLTKRLAERGEEVDRLRDALREIVFMAGMPIDIPPEDMLANVGATALAALEPERNQSNERL